MNKQIDDNTITSSYIEEQKNVWIKRWYAHIIDLFLIIVLHMVLYAACVFPIAKAITNYKSLENEIKTSINTKFKYLDSLYVIEETDDESIAVNTGYNFQYKNATAETDSFIDAYLLNDNLLNNSYVENSSINIKENHKYNDKVINYYLLTTQVLKSNNYIDANYSKITTNITTIKDFFNYLSSVFVTSDYEMFVYDEISNTISFNDNEGSAKTPDNYSIKKQLRLYMGAKDTKYLEDGKKASITNANKEIYNAIKDGYNSMIKTITEEIVTSSLEYDNEIKIINLNKKMATIISSSINIAFIISFIAYNTLIQCILKNGVTIGKKTFNFYVIDQSSFKKAKWWQLTIRSLVSFFGQLWSVIFMALIVYGSSITTAPFLTIGNLTIKYLHIVGFSLIFFLISSILMFILRDKMLTLHDLCSHTKCIKLKEKLDLNLLLSPKKIYNDEKESIDNVINNIGGENETGKTDTN